MDIGSQIVHRGREFYSDDVRAVCWFLWVLPRRDDEESESAKW